MRRCSAALIWMVSSMCWAEAEPVDLAYQYYQKGEIAQAMDSYQKLYQTKPTDPDVLMALAYLSLNQQDTAQAGLFFQQLQSVEPNNPFALAYLTRHFLPLAEQESHLLNQLNQQHAAPLYFALGNVYAEQQRWQEALYAYRQSIFLSPNHPAYLFNLAVSFDQLGQEEDAQHYYQRARQSQYASLSKLPQ